MVWAPVSICVACRWRREDWHTGVRRLCALHASSFPPRVLVDRLRRALSDGLVRVVLRCVSSVVSCSWYYIAYVACIYYSVDVRTTSWVPSAYVVVACPVVALLVSLCLCLSPSLSPPLLDLLRHPSSSSIIVHRPCLRLPHTLASPYFVSVPRPPSPVPLLHRGPCRIPYSHSHSHPLTYLI